MDLILNWLPSAQTCLTVFIMQGVLGVLAFEWAWKRTDRARNSEEAMLAEFPAFRRLDLDKWKNNKASFYPGAFLICIPRFCAVMFLFFSVLFVTKILYIGHKTQDEPVTGWRRTAQILLTRNLVRLMLLVIGYRVKLVFHDKD